MTDQELIKHLRDTLKPKGTAPVVQLKIAGYGIFNADFVNACIDTLERKIMLVDQLGESFSPLEKLAVQVLMDSAYVELAGPVTTPPEGEKAP